MRIKRDCKTNYPRGCLAGLFTLLATLIMAANAAADQIPKGWHDVSTCEVSLGWACDPDHYSTPIKVHFYADAPHPSGTFLGESTANLVREAAVGAQCGGYSNHGFSFATPVSLKDGKTHQIYVYGINPDSNDNPLLVRPATPAAQFFTCAAADTTAPTVAISAPANGAAVSGSITISASASDNVGVSKVEFYSNGVLIKTLTAAPYSFPLDTTQVSNGVYTLQAKAYDAAGNAGTSASISVTVNNVVRDAAPVGWHEGSDCNASVGWVCDPDRYPSALTVTFYADGPAGQGILLGNVTANAAREAGVAQQCGGSAAHGFVFSTPASLKDGRRHVLYPYVGSINANGAVVGSVPLALLSNPNSINTITCAAPVDTPPTVSITAPANGSTVSGTITISANASDNTGVSKVEFYLDGVLKNTDTASPYSFTLDTKPLANGVHSLQAKAYDAAGNIGISASVSITVNNVTQDITPPSAPQGLNASAVSSSQINLSWAASTDNTGVAGYKVYRGGAQIGTSAGTSFQNTGLSPSTAYSYTVAAYDAAGNVSAQSASVTAVTSGNAPVSGQLFADPSFALGVQHGWANTYPDAEDTICKSRWAARSPSLSNASWLFWEIAEKTYFCDNPATPSGSSPMTYSSSDGSKQFLNYGGGRIGWRIDTAKEWRSGCNLSLPDQNGARPKYGDPATNWPHFLIGQDIKDPTDSQGKFRVGRYSKMLFSGSILLNNSAKTGEQCPGGSWSTSFPNHELFYMTFVLTKTVPSTGGTINANTIFALVPMFYSEDGTSHVNNAEWIMPDQFGQVVYSSPLYPSLKRGQRVDYSVDAIEILTNALKALKTNYGQSFNTSDYHVSQILLGWEIWGGYSNDVEASALSLTATPISSSIDSTPPSAPTGLRATGKDRSVDLSWSASTDAGGSGLAGYRMDISSSPDFSSFAAGYQNKDVGLVTSLTAAGLISGTVYYARIRARDGNGNLSPYSGTVSAETSRRRILFAFGTSKPDDPPDQTARMKQSVAKVAFAFGSMARPAFETEIISDASQVSVASIKSRLAYYKANLGPNDTFVMYSHTHGGASGIILNFSGPEPTTITWNELAGMIAGLPARDVIALTMACHSGYLADALKASPGSWQGRSRSGRNLVVLTAVSAEQLSGATGDPNVGNSFTYAVWTGISGSGDGFEGKQRNGGVELGELAEYVLYTTREKSGNPKFNPQFAGEYNSGYTLVEGYLDHTAPSAPRNPALAKGERSITLSWDPATDNGGSELEGYRVDISPDSGFTSYVAGWKNRDVGLVVSTRAAGLVAGSTYHARIRAYDGAGNLSAYSSAAAADTAKPSVKITSPSDWAVVPARGTQSGPAAYVEPARTAFTLSSADPSDFISDTVLVKFKSGLGAAAMRTAHAAAGTSAVSQISGIDVQIVRVASGTVLDAVRSYSQDPDVLYAEPDYIAQAVGRTNDPLLDKQWHLFITAAAGTKASAWDMTAGASGVKIAIVDSGVADSHPDLTGKVSARKVFAGATGCKHGTFVAGLAAASGNNGKGGAGVAYNSPLLDVTVLSDNCSGPYSAVAEGVRWAADGGAKVINLSLGGSNYSAALEDAVNYAWSKGAVIVAAAGNSNTNAKFYPAAYGNVISVAATDKDDAKASFSNHGSWVSVAAPGAAVFSASVYPTAVDGYETGNGTSYASPIVAGLAAMIWSSGICSDNVCVRKQIEASAEYIPGTGTYWTYGRINAYRALAEQKPSNVVAVTADASDNVGVTKVEFYADSALLGAAISPPYAFPWNFSTVADGQHTLQARAYDAAGNIGSSAVVRVTVSKDASQSGRVVAVSTVVPASAALIASNSAIERPMSVSIPAASFAGEVVLSLKVPNALPPVDPVQNGGLKSTGVGLEITLDQAVQPAKAATLEVTYTDAEMAGVDRTKLVLARYDESSRGWIPLESVSYPERNTVSGRTTHFSLFQVMVLAAGTNLDSARIYPNPFYPNKGHTQVSLDGVPEGTTVKIYTLNGERVGEGKANSAGLAVWYGRNKAERKAASGLYLVYFEHDGKKKIKKVSVVK